MPVEIHISGQYMPEALAEIEQLAIAIGMVRPDQIKGVARATELTEKAMMDQINKVNPIGPVVSAPVGTVTPQKVVAAKAETKKALNRKEQDEAVKEMISNGEKDDRFEMLTKGRQNEVEDALSTPVPTAEPEKAAEAELDDMFGDEPAVNITVTREDVSALMGKVAKDEDGNAVQDKALAIRAILVENIPMGQEIKVRNIPEDKLGEVYALIKKLEG